MARSRQLKPDFFLNEDLAILPALTRLAFQGLWLLADREGRLEDRPTRIKAQLFPYHEADMDAMLKELAPAFIVRYSSGEVACIQIVNFKKHQHIHPDEKVSILPAPPAIPGDPLQSPGIMPCSPSPSPSSSPKQPRGDTPSAADLEKILSTTGDKLCKTLKRSDRELLRMQLPFKFGDIPRGRTIIDVDPVSAQKIMDTHDNLGLDLRRALMARIKLHKEELHPQLRTK